MYVEFHGAADGVTGSLHRLHVGGVDVVLDCGLFQGHRQESIERNRVLPSWAVGAHCTVLSHAHIDHSGNLPSLARAGFRGNIYSTPATRDLCSVMLRDAAMLQEQDAAFLNKRYKREGSKQRIEALYTADDVHAALQCMLSVPLHRPITIAPGVTLTFYNSGHVLGSALVVLDLVESGRKARLLFTGDLGREELPLLETPEVVSGVNCLLMESTYGDRLHPDIATMDAELAGVITKTIARGGRVYIPTFALERAQEVLFALERLHEAQRVPRVPIYIDSPLAVAITEVYKLHPEGLAADVRARLLNANDPFAPPGLRYISDIEASKALQQNPEPCIVIAGSGMCEGGRILHHFTTGLGDARNSVVIVGFMAQHTLGRRLVERQRRVKVFGVERDVMAEIHSIGGLSAHADRDDLVAFARATAKGGRLRQVALVHGEDGARAALQAALHEALGVDALIARPRERMEL